MERAGLRVDLDKGLWTIPADRMKVGCEHVVPLSPAAKRVFQRALDLHTEGARFVFQGAQPAKPLSDMTLMKVLRDMSETITAHGYRSSFRDWVSEDTQFQGDLAEAAKAHAIENKVEAAYRRGNLLEKRRGVMDAWGDYCGGKSGNILRLTAASKPASRTVSPRSRPDVRELLECQQRCGSVDPVVDAQRSESRINMHLDGSLGYPQRPGDLLV